jgi:hypothetical protein
MFAQDVITLKNGQEIQALVQKISEVDVEYKKFENPNGPNYLLRKSEIFMIKYANGSRDVFTVFKADANRQNNFLSMSDEQKALFLRDNHPELYQRFLEGLLRSKRGKNCIGVGSVFSIAGAIGMIKGVRDNNTDIIGVSTVILVLGQGFVITGIPLRATGTGIKKSVQNNYMRNYAGQKQRQNEFKINIYGNGVGLAYVF